MVDTIFADRYTLAKDIWVAGDRTDSVHFSSYIPPQRS